LEEGNHEAGKPLCYLAQLAKDMTKRHRFEYYVDSEKSNAQVIGSSS
jgi:hypothetical protein